MGQISGTQGAMLGMLGLLLGFTFAMAVARYESRQTLVLQEANSIGTAYLQAALLSESHQDAVKKNVLRRYVDARLDFYNAGGDKAKQTAAEQAAAKLQAELWRHAVAAAKEAPTDQGSECDDRPDHAPDLRQIHRPEITAIERRAAYF